MNPDVAKSVCGLNVYNGCRQVGTQLYVTGQPYPSGYREIAAAGVESVVCVRNPDETAPPAPPFDFTEVAQLLGLGISFTNLPITHGMPQASFNIEATAAALAMLTSLRRGETLIHCSSGDRASAIFAVALIATGTVNTADAIAFAKTELLLANPGIVALVQGYVTPPWFHDIAGAFDAATLTRG